MVGWLQMLVTLLFFFYESLSFSRHLSYLVQGKNTLLVVTACCVQHLDSGDQQRFPFIQLLNNISHNKLMNQKKVQSNKRKPLLSGAKLAKKHRQLSHSFPIPPSFFLSVSEKFGKHSKRGFTHFFLVSLDDFTKVVTM